MHTRAAPGSCGQNLCQDFASDMTAEFVSSVYIWVLCRTIRNLAAKDDFFVIHLRRRCSSLGPPEHSS